MTIGIYIIENPRNGKVYIGQSWNIESRWARYRRIGAPGQPKLHRALLKYGAVNLMFSILESFSQDLANQADLDAIEHAMIQKYDSLKNGYNCKEGGRGGRPGDEAKAKMSASAKGRVFSDTTRAKISAAGKGRKPTPVTIAKLKSHSPSDEHRARLREVNLGKPCTEETKVKLALANLGKTHSDATRAKISDLGRGRVPTPETRSKISQSNQGRVFTDEHREKLKEARRGRVTSDETRAKMSASQKARYRQDKDTTC